jgi:hypothetical protein
MGQVSQQRRTAFSDSALVRLLLGFTPSDVREPRQATADQLSQWFGWTDAISLSAALDGGASAMPSTGRTAPGAGERECARVRTALAKAIAEDATWRRGTNADTAATDFTPYRRRYLAQQQALDAAVGPLRARLRALLAARSPAMARLASVDVVMEQVLAPRERGFLAAVPALLEKHFDRLRPAAAAAAADPADESAAAPAASGPWLDAFHTDIRNVLLAELDFRFQPVEGLLDALRTRQPESHE